MAGKDRSLVTYGSLNPFPMLVCFCRAVKCVGWEEGSYTMFVPEEPLEHTSD